jgi:putative ferrous iron transport protein C
MRLIELKQYLQQYSQVPVMDIAHHFDTEPEVVRGMLDHWVRKGKVRHLQGVACQKGCCKTDPVNLEIYQWVETTTSETSVAS